MYHARTCHGMTSRPRVTSPARWRRISTRCRTAWGKRCSLSSSRMWFYLFDSLQTGMIFRFIATGIGGFVYPFTQVDKMVKDGLRFSLFDRIGSSPWCCLPWCQPWRWWGASSARSWPLPPRMRWISMERSSIHLNRGHGHFLMLWTFIALLW